MRLEEDLAAVLSRLRRMGADRELDLLTAEIRMTASEDAEAAQLEALRETQLSSRARLVERVRRLVAALKRIESGDFGTCVECGAAIAPPRLAALPEVATCLRCQQRLEEAVHPGEAA